MIDIGANLSEKSSTEPDVSYINLSQDSFKDMWTKYRCFKESSIVESELPQTITQEDWLLSTSKEIWTEILDMWLNFKYLLFCKNLNT